MSKKRKRFNKNQKPRPSNNGASVIVGKDSSREKIIENSDIISSSTDVNSSREKIIENNDIISAVCQEIDTLSMPSCIGGNTGVENCKNSCAKHLELDGINVEKVRQVKTVCDTENKARHHRYRANKHANYYVRNSGDKNKHVGNMRNNENRFGHYRYHSGNANYYFSNHYHNANRGANYYSYNGHGKNVHVESMFNTENRVVPYQYHANGGANDYFCNRYHHANGDANYNGCSSGDKNIHVGNTFYTENKVQPYQYHANGDANFYFLNPYQHGNGDANHYVSNSGDRNIHVENMFNSGYRVEPYRYHVNDNASYYFCNRGDKNIHVENILDTGKKVNHYQYQANNDENYYSLNHGDKNIQVGTCLSLPSKRKLLILDLNGLLADIVMVYPNKFKPDFKVHKKSVFKRPFCEEFLQFCFENFDIAVWSSRRRDNVDSVVSSLMAKLKDKLVFCWDQSHCTKTGFQTVDNKHKPLVLKELKKVWDKKEPNLPWTKGYYNPTNTLLLDDSPYKALCNPEYTGVFPQSYTYSDQNDSSLGPGGHLRVFLEGLLEADDVPSFVRTNPFGQHHITNSNPHWPFYMRVIQLAESSTLSSDYTGIQPNGS